MTKPAKAALQALFVTLLWSSSWVLIKVGLNSIPALTFAGLRYSLAFVFLLPFMLFRKRREGLRTLTRRDWWMLILLGLVYYTITQGAQFLALSNLPANTLSLILAFSAVTIALTGRLFLDEKLFPLQWVGVIISMVGAIVYFGNVEIYSLTGLAVGAIGLLANTGAAALGRGINRSARISPILVTTVSMGVGSFLLLAAGLLSEPWPALSSRDALLIAWLAAVNTALAFSLWNLTLQTLTAAQSGVINNTMLIQIAVLAWIFLDERLSWVQIAGLLTVALGTLIVQVRPGRSKTTNIAEPITHQSTN
ncbi:MAG: DMT family transporter [Anaerolineales bacterium]